MRCLSHARWGIGALAAALVLPVRAAAAPDSKRREDVVYAEARAAFDGGDFERACPLFQEYFQLTAVPAALFTLAECEVRWKKNAQALTHYEEFLQRTKDTPSPTTLQEQRTRVAAEQISRLSSQVGHVEPAIAPGTRGAMLLKLDGQPISTPVVRPIVVEPGEHTLELTAEPDVREQRTFIVGAGEWRRIEIGGAKSISEQAGGGVRPLATTNRFTTPVVVAGSLGVLGLATGAVLGGLAWAGKADIRDGCAGTTCTPQGKESADDVQSLAAGSTIAFVVGAVGAAAAVALYLLAPSSTPAGTRRGIFVGARGIGGTF